MKGWSLYCIVKSITAWCVKLAEAMRFCPLVIPKLSSGTEEVRSDSSPGLIHNIIWLPQVRIEQLPHLILSFRMAVSVATYSTRVQNHTLNLFLQGREGAQNGQL